MYLPTAASLSAALLAGSAQAWGTLGHATVAAIAENYLNDAGRQLVSNCLGDMTMVSVASWADSYRYTKGGRWSAPLHFIDAEDSPPSSCSVDFNRDCGAKGCSVSAVANYTQLVTDNTISDTERDDAMRFLIHFIGDITQPLHDEAEEVGGNEIKVTWDGKDTNLHACWDTQMVEKAGGGKNSSETIDSFSQTLIQRIDSGTYKQQAKSWISCIDPSKAQDCALQWAQDANAFNCQYVLQSDESQQELDGDYYTGAEPIIELQLAKAGYRLGNYLNNIAAGSS